MPVFSIPDIGNEITTAADRLLAVSQTVVNLNPDIITEIRNLHAAGERLRRHGAPVGMTHETINDILSTGQQIVAALSVVPLPPPAPAILQVVTLSFSLIQTVTGIFWPKAVAMAATRSPTVSVEGFLHANAEVIRASDAE